MSAYFRTFVGFSRNGKLILSYTFTKGLSLAIQGLVYNLFLLSLHFSPTLIGILDAMPAVTVLLVSLPLGMLADRVGRKTLLILCAIVNPVTLLGMALFTRPEWQVVFGLVNGMLASFYWIAYPAIIVESSTDEDRQHLFSLNSMLMLGVGSLGYLLGGAVTAVAGSVLQVSPDATAALRCGMLSLVVIGLLGAVPLFWLQEPARTSRATQKRPAYNVRLFAQLLGPDALISFGAGAVLSFNQLYFALVFGLTAASLGLFLAVAGVLGAVGAVASPALVRHYGAARAAILLQVCSAPLVAALALAPTLAVAAVVYGVWSVVRSATDPTYTGFAMSQAPDSQRSTLSGLYSVTWAAGFSAGPIATGTLRSMTHTFTAPFLMAAACYVVASAALYLFFVRRGGALRSRSQRADELTA